MVKEKKTRTLDVREQIKDPTSFPWRIKSDSVPWRIKSDSVDEINCVGVLEYIPGAARGKFMDEVYRVLVTGGKATFIVAYWNNVKAIQDYRYQWPPLSEQSFLFFNKGWREANKLELGIVCDFDFTYGYGCDPETAARNEESRSFHVKHYTNCVDALHLMLTKRP